MNWKKAVAVAAGAVVLGIVAILIYLNFIRGDAPEAFSLRTAEELAPEETSGSTTTVAVLDGVEGAWQVGPDSQAGYRVVEDLAGGIQNFEAVGRTDQVTGSLEIVGTDVTTASFEVDIASITSDNGTRDGKFANQIMNSSEFPVAVFTLLEPIDLVAIPDEGVPITVEANGELTLRDVTLPVTFPIDAQLVQGEIEVVGSIDVLFDDYGIDNPSIERVVSVRDEGVVEFQLIFVR